MRQRRLLTTRRIVPLDQVDDYLTAWHRARAAAEAAGGRAWLYRGTNRQDHFIEFLEWDEESTPAFSERDDVVNAGAEMDQTFGPGVADIWEQA